MQYYIVYYVYILSPFKHVSSSISISCTHMRSSHGTTIHQLHDHRRLEMGAGPNNKSVAADGETFLYIYIYSIIHQA